MMFFQASTYRVLDRDIDIIIHKETKGWWDKVINTHKKPAWLKVLLFRPNNLA